uniref:Uncharacterized protein n=1 Tax=Myoviridae sp. ctcyQ27 TaxID=2825139 RepID=A0A8S5UFB2_9CAUD|nr:MAG TPA: hypothetical protein [Myoviridae sp. ctcyQ27]
MMNPKAIHESILDTIINGIQDFPKNLKKSIDSGDRKKLAKTIDNKVASATSIARASAGLIFTYPVLCSSSLGIKSCTMVSKALERRNVTMLQILLAANQRTNQNIMDYLKDFHTNLDFDKMSLEDFVDVITESGTYAKMISKPEYLLEMMPLREKNVALEDFRENTNYFFEEDVNENYIGRFKLLKRNGYDTIIEADSNTDSDDDKKKNQTQTKDKAFKTINVSGRDYTYDSDADDVNKMTSPNIDSNRLLSSEIKKANEMVPTLMLINTIDPSTGANMQSVVGVKSRMISVPSGEVVGRILANYQDSNNLLKFIKLTTRETSFIKDFLLAVDNAKLDAINNSKKGSATALFNALERRSQNGKIRKMAKTEKQFAKAIATLVISQEDVEDLKKMNGIDVESIRIIKPIMEKLNLLYFVIIDESSESIKILIDGSDDYEVYPFSALEKENKDDTYKKVINLMAKM